MENVRRDFVRSDGVALEILYPPYCKVCGNPIPGSFAETHPYCGICKDSPDKYDPLVRVRAFGKYLFEEEYPDDRLSKDIRRMKTDPAIISLLQECLYYSMDHQYPDLQELDVVVPIMSGSSGRGYNQAALLARGISSRYNLPYQDVLYLREPYRPMHEIHDPAEKGREITGKVGCKHRFDGESILLIDDTCINMVTKRECSKVLRVHGAGEVWALVLGRMVNRRHFDILRGYNE